MQSIRVRLEAFHTRPAAPAAQPMGENTERQKLLFQPSTAEWQGCRDVVGLRVKRLMSWDKKRDKPNFFTKNASFPATAEVTAL